MAGLSIRLLNTDFTNYIASIDVPSRLNLIGEYYFGNNASQTQDNKVDGGTDGLIVGSGAVYYPYSALLKGTGYLNTQLLVPQEFTAIVLGKKTVNPTSVAQYTAGLMLDNYDPSTNPDKGLQFMSDQNFNALGAKIGDQGTEPITPHQLVTLDYANRTFGTDFAFQFIRASYANKTATVGYFNQSTGKNEITVTPPNLTNPSFQNSGLALKVGGGSIGQEMAYVALFSRLLTDQELNTNYASLRDFFIGKINVE